MTWAARSLSDFPDRHEKSADRNQIFDRLRANSRRYLSKRIGNMGRSDGFAVDSRKARQAPSAVSMLKIRVYGTASCRSHKARNRRSGHSTSRFCNAVRMVRGEARPENLVLSEH